MALENSDVFVVQKATGEIRKVTAAALDSYVESGDSVTYKGAGDFTDVGENPAAPSNGDLYINDGNSSGNFAWLPAPNPAVVVDEGDRAIFNGSSWDIIQSGAGDVGVIEVAASAPITVNSADPAKPVVGVTEATTAAPGVVQLADADDITNGVTNRVVTADQLADVNDNADDKGIEGITVTAPITSDNDGTNPTIGVTDATQAAKGVVQLATDDDIENSVSTKVVTADQLKVVEDKADAAAGGGISGIKGADPIEVSTSGGGSVTTPEVSIKDSAVGQKGAIAKFDTSTDISGPESVGDHATWLAALDDTGAVTIKAVATSFLLADFSEYPDA